MARGTIRSTLIVLEVFLAVAAIAGAILAVPTTSLDLLRGSLFSSYLVPALALGILVGGASLLAALALLMRHQAGVLLSLVSGIFLVVFEVVEVGTIGPQHPLQPLCLILGTAIVLLAMALFSGEMGRERRALRRRPA